MEATAPASPRAVCPRHPDKPATAACARCGTFLCEGCVASAAPPLCAACLQRRGLPVTCEELSLAGAFAGSFRLLVPRLGLVAAACAVWAVPSGLAEYLIDSSQMPAMLATWVRLAVEDVLGLFAAGAALALMVAYAEEKPAVSLGRAILEGIRAWPAMFVARLRAGVQVALWSLLLIVPGVVRGVRFSLVTIVAFRERAPDPCSRSEQLVHGQGWTMFGLMIVAEVLYQAAAFAFGSLVRMAFVLWLALPPPFVLPAQVLVQWGALVALTWAYAAYLAAYYGLKRREDRRLVQGDGDHD